MKYSCFIKNAQTGDYLKKIQIWSTELQNSITESMHHGNLAHYSVRKWRLVELDDYKKACGVVKERWKAYDNDYMKKYIENFALSDHYHHELELFNPHQNEIGCARFNSGNGFRVTCLIGPRSELAEVPRYQSNQLKCTSPFKKFKGLCTSSDLFADSSQLMFISALNEKRRQLAKARSFSNMHELTFSNNLKTTAAILNFGSILPSNRTYRAVEFKTYSNGFEYCDKDCPTLKFQNDKNQEVTFYKGYEQYHPKQTEIACVEKKDGNKGNIILCLLGPMADFRGGRAEFITGDPGSNCTMGYENKNALCSKSKLDAQATVEAPPTSPPKETTPKLVQQPPPPPPTSAPSTELVQFFLFSVSCSYFCRVTVEPAQPPPHTTTQPPTDSDDGTCPNTPPGPSQTRFTTEKVTPEPPPTHPPELADYEEIDGDEYDEDFPTGSPPSQNVYWYNDSRCGGDGLVLLSCLFVFFVFV
ncbi:hypothetical protein CRE_23155 [Caenorhabditis remanei]|uniref:SCP domain-containing protein n=1 Tax=Caenorhabditis remanei TaxID=31234 RepID=E3NFX8_CAERE|nr:hypothetical protein CRE_23155 [Caenorhabditis remanei]